MEQEKREYSIKCEALETQTNELKTKLQSSELEVNKLLRKCGNLEAQLQLLRTALQDANSSQLDQRNDTLEGWCLEKKQYHFMPYLQIVPY